MSDVVAAVIQLLRSDGPTAAQAGVDIYGGELPADAAARMPIKALVIQPSGGVSLLGASTVEHDTQRIDVIGYGATPADAAALVRVAAMPLRHCLRRTVAGVLIHWINSAGGATGGRERDGLWPQAFQSFQVFYSLEEY